MVRQNSDRLIELAAALGELASDKNRAYGNSFARSGEFLSLLYPRGVTTGQYTDMLLMVRMFDKLMRIANRKDAYGESPYADIAGYALLGVAKDEPHAQHP